MSSIQTNSQKIRKRKRNSQTGERNYVCGGCQKAYKSYPALYLHIRRKHQGIKPPNTSAHKTFELAPEEKSLPGRAAKIDIDKFTGKMMLNLENIEDSLFTFIGDRLDAVCPLSIKPKLQTVVIQVRRCLPEVKDEYLDHLRQKIDQLYIEMIQTKSEDDNDELDYETGKDIGQTLPDMILAWFMLWLSKTIVKVEFIGDICFVFSKVWRMIAKNGMSIKELDDKVVWTQIFEECHSYLTKLVYLTKKHLLQEFVKKICQFLGKWAYLQM